MSRFSEGIVEVVLVVADVPRATAFYRDVVGLVLERPADEGWAWFWSGEPGASPRLALRRGRLLFEERSPRPPDARFGPVHFAFRVARERWAEAIAHVRAAGVEVHGPARLEWMRADSVYFHDPDGNLLEWWSPDPSGTE